MFVKLLRELVFWCFVWPFLWLIMGIWPFHRRRLPLKGPAVLFVNHNSHLDIFVVMALCPSPLRRLLRPLGAADYFFRNRVSAWLVRNLLGCIPVTRSGAGLRGQIAEWSKALQAGDVLVIFPEGTRGEPEQMRELKVGIALLAELNPEVPFYPIFLYGAGAALPRGEALLVPRVIRAYVGDGFTYTGDRASFMAKVQSGLETLAMEANTSTLFQDGPSRAENGS